MARFALANISDPELMERYNALALDYLGKADEARLGPMPPPDAGRARRRSGLGNTKCSPAPGWRD
jgi:hypothetical protein